MILRDFADDLARGGEVGCRMGKQSKMLLLDRAAKYIAKGLEKGAYTDTAGTDRFAEYILEQIRRETAEI
jgi:hypothetical protein